MRPTLLNGKKFKLARQLLGIETPLLVGHLELIWASAYECGDAVFVSGSAVEAAAEWGGEPGRLAAVLSGPGSNFLDAREDGSFVVHDFWDHAPEYVRKRRMRELERQSKGGVLEGNASGGSRGPAGRERVVAVGGGGCLDNGGQRRTMADNGKPPTPTPLEGDVPSPIGQLAGVRCLGDWSTERARLARSLARAAGQGGAWLDWWGSVLDAAVALGCLADIEEAGRYARDCQDPVVRRAKDLGELGNPGGFLVSRATGALRARGGKWPRFPEVIAGKKPGGVVSGFSGRGAAGAGLH